MAAGSVTVGSTRRWQCAVALLLAFALGTHQLVMASPSHAHIMAMGVFTESSASLSDAMPDHHETAAPHSHGIETCAVEEAVLHHLPAPLPLPLVLGLLPLLALLVASGVAHPLAPVRWRWPPAKRRAMLQVFLR